MKKLLFVLSIFVLCACGSSKKKVESSDNSSSLERRLTEFMKLNEEMNFEKIMDYIYPKAFSIVPRNQLLQAMKEGYANNVVKIKLDSMKVDKIYPTFEMGNGYYAKITYNMTMLLKLTHSTDSIETNDISQSELIRASMAKKYGDDNVSIDEATGLIRIRTTDQMIAVRDKSVENWCFVNLNKEDSLINKIFSKEVLDKIATYK